jgi:protein tyrosine phosphatase (PTP) superfamily phosphohydrolase (DUF442 family)
MLTTRQATIGVGLLCLLTAAWSCPAADSKSDKRPGAAAERIEKSGLPNLHRVSADLFRSAQPTAEGMREIYKLGVRTVINLRAFHSDKDEIGEVNLAREEIPMKTWRPTEDQVVQFLRIVADKRRGPFLVHCQHGADRTGVMCAVYRVVVEGWTKDEAIREMTREEFGFHTMWGNLPVFLRELDIERVKRRAGE